MKDARRFLLDSRGLRAGWRAVIAAVALVSTVALAATASAGAQPTSTTYQADAAHSGRLDGTGLAPPLTPAWTADLGWWNYYVVIEDNRVFAIERPDHSAPVRLLALDLQTGKRLWSVPLDALQAELAVADGRVFVGTDDSGPYAGSALRAFAATDGRLLWSRPLTQWWPSPPVVVGDRVLMTGSGYGQTLFAVRAEDGTLLWARRLFGGGPVTVGGDSAMTVGSCGLREAFALDSGAPRWMRVENCEGGGRWMSAFDGARLWGVDGRTGGVWRVIDPGTGELFHPLFIGGWTPAFGDALAYRIEPDLDVVWNAAPGGALTAFDPRTLAVRWTRRLAETFNTTPLIVDRVVYAATASGVVMALDPITGATKATVHTGEALGEPWQSEHPISLAAGHGHLVIPIRNRLHAFAGTVGANHPPTDTDAGRPPATATPKQPARPHATVRVPRTLKIRRGRVRLTVSCPAKSATTCRGRLIMTRAGAKSRRTTIASVRFAIRPQERRHLTLQISPRTLRLVRRAESLRVRIALAPGRSKQARLTADAPPRAGS